MYNEVQEAIMSTWSLQTSSRINGILLISGHGVTFFATRHKDFQNLTHFQGLLSNLPPTDLCLEFDPWVEQLTSVKNHGA